MGSGPQTVGTGGASFIGTTIDNGTTFSVDGPATFTNVSNNAAVTVESGQTLTWNGGDNANTLNVDAGAVAMLNGLISTGVITITGTGSVSNSGANLILNGGSRTLIGSAANPGGTLSTAAGTTIELNGGLLDNNGVVNGTVDVNYGSLAEGAGTYNGSVNVSAGGAFHPGNSPGVATTSQATWGSGGEYQFDIENPIGLAGTDWSLWQVIDLLTIEAGTTPNSQFVIDVNSLDSSGDPGLLTDFNPYRSYTWEIASAGDISGFSAAEFSVNTSGFQNSLVSGAFSVTENGSQVDLVFTAVPEPRGVILMLGGLATLGLSGRRQRPISQALTP